MALKEKINHMAIIMDGNRRWAKRRSLPVIEGHRQGVESLKNMVKTCHQLSIKFLTVYAFSTENWKRPEQELGFLFNLFVEVALKELSNLKKQNVKVSFLGDLEAFKGSQVKSSLLLLQEETKNNQGLNLQVALNYGSVDEMTRALRKIKDTYTETQIVNLTESDFASFLDTASIPYPDLIIRTGGAKRLSNFLLWQAANAQLFFTDTLWPDFSNLEEALC